MHPGASEHVRVLLVDDHARFRRGVRRILEAEPRIQVVGEAADAAAAWSLSDSLHPDVVLMDVSLPDGNGIDVTRRITGDLGLRVLILSMHADPTYVRESRRAGALGYVVKADDDADLAMAVLAVQRGETYLSASARDVG